MNKHIGYQIKVSATLKERKLQSPYFVNQFNNNLEINTFREKSKSPSNSPSRIGPIIKEDPPFEDILFEKRLALEIPPGLFESDLNRLGTNFIKKIRSHKTNLKKRILNLHSSYELDESKLYDEEYLSEGFDSTKE